LLKHLAFAYYFDSALLLNVFSYCFTGCFIFVLELTNSLKKYNGRAARKG